nr:MAG TPA: hypothetical protein [Caudoviricetes sp.]
MLVNSSTCQAVQCKELKPNDKRMSNRLAPVV